MMYAMILSALAAAAAAYSPSSRPAITSRFGTSSRASIGACAVATEVSTADAAKLFGRLAEPVLYLDPTIGACCHSACSDCEWRDPEGGYRFDLLKAMQPKWVPCYRERDFADERGSHTTRWSSVLFPDGAESVD